MWQFSHKYFNTLLDSRTNSPRTKARQGLWVQRPRQGKARQGKARQGKARQGKARQGKARQGKARQGKARQGKARQGKARQRQGKARQGKGFRVKDLGKARTSKSKGKARISHAKTKVRTKSVIGEMCNAEGGGFYIYIGILAIGLLHFKDQDKTRQELHTKIRTRSKIYEISS